MTEIYLDVHLRQMGICDPAELNDRVLTTTIVGAGGIGSSAALALAKMGKMGITVYDFDDLEEHNLGNQFLPFQIGDQNFLRRKKVEALEALVNSLVPGIPPLVGVPTAFTPESPVDDLTIAAVDSMAARKMIYDTIKDTGHWLIDGRMAAQVLDIFVIDVTNAQDRALYEATLYTDAEAMEEPCTARGIVFTSMFAGAHIANLVKRLAFGPRPPYRTNHVIEHGLMGNIRREP